MTDETAKALAAAMDRLAAALEAQDRHNADHPVVAPIGRSWPSAPTPLWSAPYPSTLKLVTTS